MGFIGSTNYDPRILENAKAGSDAGASSAEGIEKIGRPKNEQS
jgi:hypothetical protein